MTEKEEKDIAESQKLSKRDKKEIQDGACVNCVIVSFVFMAISVIVLLL